MKRTLLLILLLATAISCAEKFEKEKELAATDPECLQQDMMSWWTYHHDNIILSEDFVPLNQEKKVIEKGDFLKKLTSGDYIPIKVESEDSLTYQLFALEETADEKISGYIKSDSSGDYRRYLMEGQKLPAFEFQDLEGNVYTNTNTLGKMLVLKAWFINCKPCVAEMPDLNKLVERYEERENVKFIGLATDPEEDLQNFLKKTEFKYAVAADQGKFLKSLGIQSFPTHILVDETGTITKVLNNYEELERALEGTPIPDRKSDLPPPPPPPPGPGMVSRG